MAIVTPEMIKALSVGFKASFQDALQVAPSEYKKLATIVPSVTASNTYGWLGQFPQLREWIGDRVVKDMAAQGYQITNKLFESTVGVNRTDIEDDNVGIYSPLFSEMGRAAGSHPDELAFALLKAGHATLCFDGQNFFDTDHPVYPNVDGTGMPTAVSNSFAPAAEPGPAWYLLDTRRALKPLIYQERTKAEFAYMTKDDDEQVFMADEFRYGIRVRCNVGFGFWQMAVRSTKPLDAASFQEAYDAMRGFKADGGRPLDIRPNLLVVPSALRSAAVSVVGVETLAGGASNPNYKLADLLETAWIS